MRPLRTRLTGASFVAALVVAALTGGASAQLSSAQQSAMKQSCRSDFMAKCSGVSPGGKEALACLQQNVETLSPACQQVVSSTMPQSAPAAAAPAATPPAATPAAAQPTAAQQNAMKQSCRADFMSHCSGVSPGGKDALACLQKNASVLSAACKKAVAAIVPGKPAATPVTAVAAPAQPTAAQQNAMKQYCRGDVMAHCQGTSGKIALACLQRNVSALSPDCQKVVATTMPNRGPAVVAVPPPVEVAPPAAPGLAPASALIAKACARDIVMHCRGIEPGGGRIAGCLKARIASGSFVGPRCRTALKVSAALD